MPGFTRTADGVAKMNFLLKYRQRIVRETWMVLYQEDDSTHPRFDKRVAAVGDGFLLGWTVGQWSLGDERDKSRSQAAMQRVRGIIDKMRKGEQSTVSVLGMHLIDAPTP